MKAIVSLSFWLVRRKGLQPVTLLIVVSFVIKKRFSPSSTAFHKKPRLVKELASTCTVHHVIPRMCSIDVFMNNLSKNFLRMPNTDLTLISTSWVTDTGLLC
jgi:hypothetical protein